MTRAGEIDRARESFERQAWRDAYLQLSAADGETPLEPADLQRLATSAYLLGDQERSAEVFERAHHALLEQGDVPAAVRCAFWIGVILMQRGSHARAGGWIARAGRLLEETQVDCVERGYVLMPVALQTLEAGDPVAAEAIFLRVVDIAHRFDDRDLLAFGRLGRGRSLLRTSTPAEGATLLDEAMVAVTANEVSPIVAGIVYCAVILACHEICDVRRAQEWTEALSHWCAKQPDLMPFRGQCLVHRSQILQLHGEWSDAMKEAQQACEHLSYRSDDPVLGMALYQRAELQRLRGETSQAERAYREAGRRGHSPHPGLALLRLAQGQIDAARAAIQRVLKEIQENAARSIVLAACVDIELAANDVDAARSAAHELAKLAADLDTPYLHALAQYARGAVLMAEENAEDACKVLRRAWAEWQEMSAPYEAARTRVLIGLACGYLGDYDTAEIEFDAARSTFQRLGAGPDLARVQGLSSSGSPTARGGLTPRELEVLALVAAGKTNRAIAEQLFISDKTVARHISNIFTKLDLSSRSAATAYAYEHDLV